MHRGGRESGGPKSAAAGFAHISSLLTRPFSTLRGR
jgi:hypothetical protein